MFKLLIHTYVQTIKAFTAAVNKIIQIVGREAFNAFKWIAFWIICAILGVMLGRAIFNLSITPPPPQQQKIIRWQPIPTEPDDLLKEPQNDNDLLRQ